MSRREGPLDFSIHFAVLISPTAPIVTPPCFFTFHSPFEPHAFELGAATIVKVFTGGRSKTTNNVAYVVGLRLFAS